MTSQPDKNTSVFLDGDSQRRDAEAQREGACPHAPEVVREGFSRKERKGWKRVRLGDVLSYEQPYQYIVKEAEYVTTGTPVLTPGKTFILGYTNETKGIYHASRAKPIILFDDFLTISRLVDFDFKVKSSALKILSAKSDGCNLRYISYVMSQLQFDVVDHQRHWIGQFSKLEIALPVREIQDAVASALDTVDTHITALQSLIAKYEAIKKATVNLLLTPKEGWKRVKLGDVAETSSGGTPSRNNESYYQGTIPWFTTSELRDEVLYDSKEHIRQEALQNSAAKVFPEGTLLLAMYGATIGKLGVLAKPASTNQACCAIQCGSNIETAFLFQVLYSRRQEIIALGCGAGQPNISQLIVRNLNLVLPPLSEQRKIAKQIAAIDEVLHDCRKQLDKVQNLKRGMMSYFFG